MQRGQSELTDKLKVVPQGSVLFLQLNNLHYLVMM